jgi:AcrR family transcriptional regulator
LKRCIINLLVVYVIYLTGTTFYVTLPFVESINFVKQKNELKRRNKTNKYPEKKILIFKATIDLIAESGFQSSPAAKIAEESGIGVGTIYRYFKSKDTIFDELFRYIEEEINSAIIKGFDINGPVREQFNLLCRNLIYYSLENPKPYNYFNVYIDSQYGTSLRMVKRSRDRDNISQTTLLYPFFKLFDKARSQHLIEEMPNSVLFTLIFGALSHFIRDVSRGIVECNAEMEDKVIKSCWNIIKKQH